jgi:CrcB protein
MSVLLAVAAGGAFGAVGRYLVLSWAGHRFGTNYPYGTLLVNVAGSFLLGVLTALAALAWAPPAELKVFLAVGLLGAFTTFSTFAMDVAFLAGRRAFAAAAVYIVASAGLSIAGFLAGLAIVRAALA